jgi:hypothetical protein
MVQLEHVRMQLRAIGRCAMVGTLIGLTTAQSFAAGATASSQPATQPETNAVSATQTIAAAPTANLPLVASDNTSSDASALPEAPAATEETASVTKPIDIRAVMDDTAQNTQNLQPATTQPKPHQVHPAWLVLSAIGGLGMWIGAEGLTRGTRGKPLAGAFLGAGAGLTGLGLYLTFK